MQKHERVCLAAAQEAAAKLSGDLTVSHTIRQRGTMRLTLSGLRGSRHRTITASANGRDNYVTLMHQWVRRAAQEIN